MHRCNCQVKKDLLLARGRTRQLEEKAANVELGPLKIKYIANNMVHRVLSPKLQEDHAYFVGTEGGMPVGIGSEQSEGQTARWKIHHDRG